MSIKAKQVAGVTSLVVLIVAVLSGYHLATLARLSLQETASRAELLSRAIFQRAREVVATPTANPYAALRADGGIRSILESSIGYSRNVTYAAIVDPKGIAVAHSFPSQEGTVMPEQENFAPIVASGALEQLRAVYSDRTFEITEPILAGDEQFASVRIGVSPLLVRNELQDALKAAAGTVLAVLGLSMMVAMVLAQWMLRPIHVIQSGLSRLGRGELDVRLDLPEGEFKDLGSSFEAVSAQLAALGRASSSDPGDPHTVRPGGSAEFESVMENLEDAVALFSPRGDLIFNNAAMRALAIPDLPASHPARQLVERTLAGRKSQGPVSLALSTGSAADSPERLLMSHAIEDTNGRFLGAMLVAQESGLLESGAFDPELLAEAGRARPADDRRGSRSEESAQRDDDSPRASEAEADGSARGRHRAGRAAGGSRAARRSLEAREHHLERDPAARRGGQRLPQVCASG